MAWFWAISSRCKVPPMSHTIGIIGGADGPTAVFIAGNPLHILLGIAGIAAVLLLGIWFFKKK